MKRLLSLYPLLLLVSVAAQAAETANERATAEIAALEAKLQAGLAARDAKLLDPLLADPFIWVHSSDGRVDGRKGWLAEAARGMALSGQRNARTEHGASLVFHGEGPHTAIRVARVRIVDAAGGREIWMRQTHTLVRDPGGPWKLAMGQGVVMYDGARLDPALHARYAGTYVIDGGRNLVLEWTDGALLATFPNGAQTQIFLASPAQEAMRNPAAGVLHFMLDAQGNPKAASLVRGSAEVWKANRQ
jgi:ketosteroid isomerase-like protein